ncbi:YegS/Rv2252/BmrU family lipid kinase [Sporosarcina sp.]|uniref:YegS/Rv2252/BmrU family lipid kinase n=1 Tax=Sporosarcina sp. TaxID=49982 RepID=UPI0026321106|nr:YegS/Rv2252/BmrU family lipid kinase [Sporosarcina sp.]
MLHFNRALFVYNRSAGDADSEKKLADTLPVLTQAVDELILMNTKSKEELQKACVHYSNQVDLLIILGGDGTVHTCLNSIAPLPVRPIVAILPGGTSNDFSRTLGLPQDLRGAAESLMNGTIFDTDVGRMDDRYFMNFWGIGLVTETSENINDGEKAKLGPISYFLSTLRTINQAESFTYKISVNGELIEGETILLFVLNGRFIGTTELPISSLSPMDGKLDVLLVRDSNFSSLRELFKLQNPATDSNQLDQLEYFQTDELEIVQPTNKKIDMDGEIYDDHIQHIKILPGHIRMIYANN